MNQNQFSLKDVADILRVRPYRIQYLLATGKVPEPTRIGGNRIFDRLDLHRLAEHLGVEQIDESVKEWRRDD